MPKFYAATNHDGNGCIDVNADIYAFDTREEAESFLLDPRDLSDNELEYLEFKIETGRFSDCWRKYCTEPTPNSSFLDPFDFDDLYIAKPGEHPGGNVYWITPRPDVLVVVLRPKA